MAKGKSGSFRANSLSQSDLQAMENHELRLDHSGARRSIRKDTFGAAIPPLIYNPLRANTLTHAKDLHTAGAKMNKAAAKVARHAFIQFPTDLEVTAHTQQMMLDQAVAFVNQTHGGQAVFWARIDRDEAGQHGVDVFYAPKYEKATKRKTEVWVSLTKFGKERAVERFQQKPLEKRNHKTGEFEPVKDANGNAIMVDCDSKYYQGRAFQDLWFEHLRNSVGLDWVQRGDKKIGRDADRLEVEEYKLLQEKKKISAELEADRERNISQQRIIEITGQKSIEARNEIMAKARDQASKILKNAEKEAESILAKSYDLSRMRSKELDEKEANLKEREKEIQATEKEMLVTLEKREKFFNTAVNNLSVAINIAIKDTHENEIMPSDMGDQPLKYKILQDAAPEGKPTIGFRAKFWALNYSDGSGNIPDKYLPAKIREAFTTAFDSVAKWAKSKAKLTFDAVENTKKVITNAQAEAALIRKAATDAAEATSVAAARSAQKDAVEAAEAILSRTHAQANEMLSEARSRAPEVLSAEKQLWANLTVTRLIKEAVIELYGQEGHLRIKEKVDAVWLTHPDNVNREVPRPVVSYSSPNGP